MASGSGYLLFSQTSRAPGTRDAWSPPGLPGGVSGSAPGLVDGVAADFARSAFTAFGGTEFVRADWALLGLGQGPLAAFADLRAFDAPPGARNPAFASLPVEPSATLSIALSDADWNGVKNLELLLPTAELESGALARSIAVRNIVDVRIKLGDGPGAPREPWLPPETVAVAVENLKRGEIDASQSPFALDAVVTLASNGPGWGNTVIIRGGVEGDTVAVRRGDWDAPRTALDGFTTLATDGRHSLVIAELGDGNDVFDAGPLIARNEWGEVVAETGAVQPRTDIRMGTDGGWFRLYAEPFGYGPSVGPIDADNLGFYPMGDIDLFFRALPVPGTQGQFMTATLLADATFFLNGHALETVRLDVPGGEVLPHGAEDTPWWGADAFPLGGISPTSARFFDRLSLAFLEGNETEVVSFRQREGIVAFVSQALGDEVICSDGSDVVRYAAGDGFDIVRGFDPAVDRIVLEGIAPEHVSVLGHLWDLADESSLPSGAMILTDTRGLPQRGTILGGFDDGPAVGAAIFLPGVTGAQAEAALIFA